MVVPTSTTVTRTPSGTTAPTAAATPSATPVPSLPCGERNPEGTFAFLDCADIRRIRQGLATDPRASFDFEYLTRTVDGRRASFPTSYNPNASWEVLWWGSGNYTARDMALVYLITGDLGYAEDVLRLLDLVRSNTPPCAHLCGFDSTIPDGNFSAGGLLSHPAYGGVVFQSLLFGYLAVRNTSLVDEADRQSYDSFFTHQAELLEEAAAFRGNTAPLDSWISRNVPVGANLAALTIAASFPEEPAMQRLEARLRPRLEWQLANWWHADGGWGEDTEGYGFRVLEEALLLAETLQRAQGEDWYAVTFGANSLQRMCVFYLDILTPEGTTPSLNDTTHYFVDPGLFNLCGYRSADPRLYFAADAYAWGREHAYGTDSRDWQTLFHSVAWVGLRSGQPVTPDFTSVLLPDTGAAILRSDWTHEGQYLLLQFTGSRVHDELSYGAVYLFDRGPWMVGNGYHLAGESQPAGERTDQHSTLALDETSQSRTSGESTAFADVGNVGIASVSSQSYPALRHGRTILWTEPLHEWLVVDDAVTDAWAHTLQLRWYVRGEVASSEGGDWAFRRSDRAETLWIRILPPSPAIYRGIERHYNWEQWVSDAQGVRMDLPTAGSPVRIVTLLAVSGSPEPLPSIERIDDAGGTLVVLDHPDQGITWQWVLPFNREPETTVVDFRILGNAGCRVERSGSLEEYCLLNGTELAYQGRPLVESTASLCVEADLSEGKIAVDSPQGAELSLFWPMDVRTVREGEAAVPFELTDGVLRVHLEPGRHVLSVVR
jgi:hypothetical protein